MFLKYIQFVAFKRNKNLQKIIGDYTIKNGKVFKTQPKNRKGKCEPCKTSDHHYVASRSLTPVYSEVTKYSNYTAYFTN